MSEMEFTVVPNVTKYFFVTHLLKSYLAPIAMGQEVF
jgi:hypothetical protein